jgi:hypothetical protein
MDRMKTSLTRFECQLRITGRKYSTTHETEEYLAAWFMIVLAKLEITHLIKPPESILSL